MQKWCEDELQRLKDVKENTAAGAAALSPVEQLMGEQRRQGGRGRGGVGSAPAPGDKRHLSSIGRPGAARVRANGGKIR